jgi:hypothetical protein
LLFVLGVQSYFDRDGERALETLAKAAELDEVWRPLAQPFFDAVRGDKPDAAADDPPPRPEE